MRPGYEAWTPARRVVYGVFGMAQLAGGTYLAVDHGPYAWWPWAVLALVGLCQVLGAIWPVMLGRPRTAGRR